MGAFFAALGHFFLTIALPAAATAATGLGIAYLQKQLAKAGLDLTAAQVDGLKTASTHAVQAVEELAARRAAAGSPMTGSEKKNAATEMVAKAVPNVPISGITTMIDAVLPEVRAKLGNAAGKLVASAIAG